MTTTFLRFALAEASHEPGAFAISNAARAAPAAYMGGRVGGASGDGQMRKEQGAVAGGGMRHACASMSRSYLRRVISYLSRLTFISFFFFPLSWAFAVVLSASCPSSAPTS